MEPKAWFSSQEISKYQQKSGEIFLDPETAEKNLLDPEIAQKKGAVCSSYLSKLCHYNRSSVTTETPLKVKGNQNTLQRGGENKHTHKKNWTPA